MSFQRLAAALAACTSIVALATPAIAQELEFNIPSGSLESALDAFGRQSGPIVYQSDQVKGARSAGYRGSSEPRAALVAILTNTGLTYRTYKSGAVAIVRTDARQPAGDSDAPSAEPESANDQNASEIIVTGSRISRPGVTAPTPVSSIDAEAIQAQQPTTLADTLFSIPSFRSSTNPSNTGVTTRVRGGATADLRGLGASGAARTLVLVDGRRFVASGPNGIVDLKAIPTMMIRQIEVVTGGASAAWGSDAVGGVVNLILRKDIKGLEVSSHAGISGQGDNKEFGVSIATGGSFLDDRLHISLGADYLKNYGVGNQYERDWGRREVGLLTNAAAATNGLPQYIISPNVRPSNMTPGGLIVSGPLRGTAFNPGRRRQIRSSFARRGGPRRDQ